MSKKITDKIKEMLTPEDLKVFEAAIEKMVDTRVKLKEEEIKSKYDELAEEYVSKKVSEELETAKATLIEDYDEKLKNIEQKVVTKLGSFLDHVIVEQTEISNNVDIAAYKEAIATNYGGVSTDYYIFILDPNSTEAKRIRAGDEHVFIWNGDIITGIDFSIEDNRKLFMIRTVDPDNKSIVKDTIVGNNIDSVVIQTRTCLADGTLDTSVNATTLIPVIVPDTRIIYLKATIVNGVGNEIVFKTALEGIWSVVPTNIMVGSEKMRIWGDNGEGATNTINVLMNI